MKIFLRSRWCVFFLLLAFIWLGLVLVKAIYKKYQLGREIESLKMEIAKMDGQERELIQLIDYFGNQDYLEKEAREKLNLKREGEKALMVAEEDLARELAAMTKPADSEELESAVSESNWIKWWNFFFKK